MDVKAGGARLRGGSRVTLGAFATGLIVYWLGVTVPVLAVTRPAGLISSSAVVGQPVINELGLIETKIGCARSLGSADLDEFFAERRGPLVGWDNAHVMQLGPERWLWLSHDAFLDYVGDAKTLDDVGAQIQNVAFEQTGTCFSMLHRGTPEERRNFEIGDGHVDLSRFLWPLGGEVDGDVVKVFWAETVPSVQSPGPTDGIVRNPTKTWLAEYDLTTLERLSFAPAPNSGVDPIYGFAVASDDEYSYLFGNTNMLNFALVGGYLNGPHSVTKMYLGRVERGRLEQQPEYWTGSGWSDDAASSVPISDRFFAENTMQPRYIDGRWVSVVKENGFSGKEVLIDVAEDPWGPWTTVDRREHVTRPATVEKNSYQPIILPWSSVDMGLSVIISENAMAWDDAIQDPPLYRPAVLHFDWPLAATGVDTAVVPAADSATRDGGN